MLLQRYYIIFVTSQTFNWSCHVVCSYLWMNTQTKLINHVLLLELWEAYFVLESGYQESLGMLFGGIPPHREESQILPSFMSTISNCT